MVDYKYLNYGDSTICISFSDESTFTEEGWEMAHALSDNILSMNYEWVISVIPTMNSTLVHFDILKISFQSVAEKIDEIMKETKGKIKDKKKFNIPVVYGGDFGPDLPNIANKMECTEEKVIKLHVESVSNLLCFTNPAGQPLMGGSKLPDYLHRLNEPRTKIPVGSVGIVGNQSTVYCMDSPGGWQIIGRTPVKMIHTNEMPPTYLNIGDSISFFEIAADEWNDYVGKELDKFLID